jgi:EAL domain-containing protein (putative c-di-GMP-specific phosphodiesterase class I)
MGCGLAQGFAFSPALPAAEMEAWLATAPPIVLDDPAPRLTAL